MELQSTAWCNMVLSDAFCKSSQGVLMFLGFLLACPSKTVFSVSPYESVCKHVFARVVAVAGQTHGPACRKPSSSTTARATTAQNKNWDTQETCDEVNKFILLEKLGRHKGSRNKIASTHTGLAASRGNLVEREAHSTVALYNQKVAEALADGPKQVSTSWDPSTYGGRNTLVSTLFAPSTGALAVVPNQNLKKIVVGDVDDSFIEETKASKLRTIEGYSELRSLSHALLLSTGCNLMDFRIFQNP